MPSPKKKGWKARVVGMIPGGGLISGIFKFLWAVLRSRVFWILALVGFVLFLALTLAIMSTAGEAPSPKAGTPAPNTTSWWEWFAEWFVIIMSSISLILVTIFLVRLAYRDCFTTPPAAPAPAPPPVAKFDWSKAYRNSVLILSVAVPVINIFFAALATTAWIWWFNHFILFLFSNLGVIIAGHFFDKGTPLNKGVAGLIAFFILVGFFRAGIGDARKKADELYAKATLGLGNFGNFSLPSSPFAFGNNSGLAVGLTEEEVASVRKGLEKVRPAERVVLGLIASCDPTHPLFQVRKDQLPAIKAYAEKGVAPWLETKDCWLPKLTGARQSFNLAVVDATSEFDEDKEVAIPQVLGYRITYSCQPGQDFVRRLNRDKDLVLRQYENAPTGVYTDTVGFKGLNGAARVVVSMRPKGAISQ